MGCTFSPEGNREVPTKLNLKKTQFLRGGLYKLRNSKSGTDQGSSDNDSKGKNCGYVVHHNALMEPFYSKDAEYDLLHQNDETLVGETKNVEDPDMTGSGGSEDFAIQLSSEHANDSGDHSPCTQPLISKSNSLTDMGNLSRVSSGGGLSSQVYVEPQRRSSDDLSALDAKSEEILIHKSRSCATEDDDGNGNIVKPENGNCQVLDNIDINIIDLVKDRMALELEEIDMNRNLQRDSSFQRTVEFPSNDFKIKRIEEWISMIELEDSAAVLEENEIEWCPSPDNVKLDAKPTVINEVVKTYISSLTSASTSAQLVNHGLVVMPALSAFINLKVLNLSGNGIVRISASALPRGLHVLNLSKNKISTIEGLRELTRLRALDLSYNRISRIGHGLASCSAIKELHVAGNKISEVEGLHRLLKLNVLDLRFNKISTQKCLAQLAANYGSLQTISLEGNPAQRNVGDEQVKKYLQGILPNLVSFNSQPMKAGAAKELNDRTLRSSVTTTHRGLRSEHKPIPKVLSSHKLATHKQRSSSASPGQRRQT